MVLYRMKCIIEVYPNGTFKKHVDGMSGITYKLHMFGINFIELY